MSSKLNNFLPLIVFMGWFSCGDSMPDLNDVTGTGETTQLPRANIVFIMADDLGWGDVSTGRTNLNHPNDFFETPTLERLAVEGVPFNQAYSDGPNCAPTRAAILSGHYATRPTNNVFNVGDLNRTDGQVVPLVGPPQGLPTGQAQLPSETNTIGEVLRQAGYATGHSGKYHVGSTALGNDPLNQGFDFVLGGNLVGPYHAFLEEDTWRFQNTLGSIPEKYALPYTQDYIDDKIKPFSSESNPETLLDTPKHVTDAFTDAAIDFMEERKSEPFFLNFWHTAVHTPITEINARRDLLAKYQAKPPGLVSTNASFGAIVEGFDQSVARVIDYLEKTPDPRNPGEALAQNTWVFVFSDNGGKLDQSSNGPLRGQKGELHEGGIRVPFIVWAPGHVEPAAEPNATPVTGLDLFATFGEIAESEYEAQNPDGESLLSHIRSNQELERSSLFWHFPGYLLTNGRDARPNTVIQQNNFKLTYYYETQSYTLFDLDTDISESIDLLSSTQVDEAQELATSMSQKLIEWLQSTQAPLPQLPNGDDVPLPAIY